MINYVEFVKEPLFNTTLNSPYSIAIDAADNIFFIDLSFRIRKITKSEVITIIGKHVNRSDVICADLKIPYISQFDTKGNLLMSTAFTISIIKNISFIPLKKKIYEDFTELTTCFSSQAINITGKIFYLHTAICSARCTSVFNLFLYK